MKTTTLSVFAALLLCAACKSPTDGQPKATTSAPIQEVSAPVDAATKYSFSAADSKLEWVGAKVTASHDGSFKDFKGSIDLVDGDPTKSRVSVTISTASLVTEPEKLIAHLKNADFFDVEKFPEATFTSTSITSGGAGGSHTVTGNLALHGVTKSVSFPATIQVAGDEVTVQASFGINRKDFGIVYPGAPDDLIKDDVLVRLNIKAKKS